MVFGPSAVITHTTRHIRSLELFRGIEVTLGIYQVLRKFLTTTIVEGGESSGNYRQRYTSNDGQSGNTSPRHLLLLQYFTHLISHQRVASILLKRFLQTSRQEWKSLFNIRVHKRTTSNGSSSHHTGNLSTFHRPFISSACSRQHGEGLTKGHYHRTTNGIT